MPYPKHPTTIGEHILKRRYELELFQKDVGKQIGVCAWTIMNWEQEYSKPAIQYYPAIIAFLGYEPFPKPKTPGENIIVWRRRNGMSRKALATKLKVDESVIKKCELDERSPSHNAAKHLVELCNDDPR